MRSKLNRDTYWINVYPNGAISNRLFLTKEEALGVCTYTKGKPNAEQRLVRIVEASDE